jgi:hypothetical protein
MNEKVTVYPVIIAMLVVAVGGITVGMGIENLYQPQPTPAPTSTPPTALDIKAAQLLRLVCLDMDYQSEYPPLPPACKKDEFCISGGIASPTVQFSPWDSNGKPFGIINCLDYLQ